MNDSTTQFATGDSSLDEQALLLLIATQDLPEADREQKQRDWCQRSPGHELAFARAAAEWEVFADIGDKPLTLTQELGIRAQAFVASSLDHPARSATALSLAVLLLIVVGLTLNNDSLNQALLAPPTAIALHPEDASFARLARRVHTGRGEQRELLLADGSRLWLNWNTEVLLLEHDDAIHVDVLVGDVLFSVASERGRPLVVYASRTYAYAVDTEFAIHSHGNDDALFQVRRGELTIASSATQSKRMLTTAEQMYFLNGLGGSLGEADLKSIAAWREGKLVFDERPLKEVLAELSHYTARPLQFASEWLPEVSVDGDYAIGEADQAVLEIADAYNLELIESGSQGVLVRPVNAYRR